MEIKELMEQLKMIKEFYEIEKPTKKQIIINKIKNIFKKGKKKSDTNYTSNDTDANNTIHNNSNSNSWFDDYIKIFNDKEINNNEK